MRKIPSLRRFRLVGSEVDYNHDGGLLATGGLKVVLLWSFQTCFVLKAKIVGRDNEKSPLPYHFRFFCITS